MTMLVVGQNADGGGSSLVVVDAKGDYGDENNWRASYEYGGLPGKENKDNENSLVITEILSHTDLPLVDTIEIKNNSDSDIDISGWYISDSDSNWKKYQIPQGTIIPAQGFITFDESQFKSNGIWNPDAVEPQDTEFAISSSGDQIYLIEATNGRPLYYAAEENLGPRETASLSANTITQRVQNILPLWIKRLLVLKIMPL